MSAIWVDVTRAIVARWNCNPNSRERKSTWAAISAAARLTEHHVRRQLASQQASGGRRVNFDLTEQQIGILRRLAVGKSLSEIATENGCGRDTLDSRLRSMLARLNARSIAHAVYIATIAGLIGPWEVTSDDDDDPYTDIDLPDRTRRPPMLVPAIQSSPGQVRRGDRPAVRPVQSSGISPASRRSA